jgi:anti-sigma B factor antagonist
VFEAQTCLAQALHDVCRATRARVGCQQAGRELADPQVGGPSSDVLDNDQRHAVDEASQLHVELLWPRADLVVVVVEGELDLYTAARLDEALGEGIDKGALRFVVDLAAVPFIDSTGLGVLIKGLKDLRPRGGSLDVVCSRANILRAFKAAALVGFFGLYASREEALAACGGPRVAE